jgi:hypothetical protein
MIFDNTLIFSAAQAITAPAASTNTIDMGATGTPYGASAALVLDPGRDMHYPDLSITVTQAFNNLTSLTVSYQTSLDNATWTSAEDVTVPLAALILGYQFREPRRIPQGAYGRYHRLYFTPNGTAPTTGAINAEFVASRQTNISYGAI